MTQIKKLVAKLKRNPNDVKFDELAKVCDDYFGEPRQQGTSHRAVVTSFWGNLKRRDLVYKTPWSGDPRVNIENKKGKAKSYQVRQVLAAINKLEGMDNG